MHEASMVADLVDAVLKELEKYDVTKVNAVTVIVGDLTQLGADQMEFAYEVITQGTILEGSELIIEPEHIVLGCDACGYEGPPDTVDLGDPEYASGIPVLVCPKCGGHVRILEGETCRVKNMDIETGDE